MKTLDRMILRQVIAPFVGSLATFSVIMLLDRMFDLMDLLIRKGVPPGTVGLVVAYTMPFILSFTAPMAVLVAILVAFGRMAQDNEVLAAKSLGISAKRLAYGPFVGAIVLVGVLFWANNYLVPEANHRLKTLLVEIGQKRPTAQIKKGLFTQIEGYLVYVEDKDDRTGRIEDVKIQEMGGSEPKTIIAKRGRVFVSGDTVMVFALEDGEIHQAIGPRKDVYRLISFERYKMKIPINPEMLREERKFRADKEKLLSHLAKDLSEQEKNLGKPGLDPGAKRSVLIRIAQIWVELHKRFALPVAGLIFVLLGVPVAVMTRRGGYGTAFGISFFIFVLYYIMLLSGEQLSTRGILPHPVIWVPNLLFVGLAIWLIRKEERK
ncbi:MAG: LptF/LptG family permease [candidate division WOR-3 bacterium]